jgi:hypothetical protein
VSIETGQLQLALALALTRLAGIRKFFFDFA